MSQRRRLSIVLALNAAMIVVLVIAGISTHSLGVLAAGGDYAADSAAILLGIIAVTLRNRSGGSSRAPTYVALINGTALLVVTVFVIAEAVHRLLTDTPTIYGLPVLIVSLIATVVMVIGALVLGADAGREDLHMRSVLLDTVSDAVTSAAVAVAGGVIYFTGGLYWLDSILAAVIGLVIGAGAVRLLVDVVVALRHGAPIRIEND